jgi:hypothetical protein
MSLVNARGRVLGSVRVNKRFFYAISIFVFL